jgi:catechol 2,3-dioxygenase-like lactoylglutathione lyase family enzyme
VTRAAPASLGVRHVALRFHDLPAAERFFVELLGYRVEWRPDADNIYLTSGSDNVALHRAFDPAATGRFAQAGRTGMLDHIGIVVGRADDVDGWARYLRDQGVTLETEPKTHRDGARSLYLRGPEGLLVQVIHHPPISAGPAATTAQPA